MPSLQSVYNYVGVGASKKAIAEGQNSNIHPKQSAFATSFKQGKVGIKGLNCVHFLQLTRRNCNAHIVRGKENSATQPKVSDPRDEAIKDLQHQVTALKASLNSNTPIEQPGTYATTSHASNSTSSTPWIIDSGATNHISGNKVGFSSFCPASREVKLVDGSTTNASTVANINFLHPCPYPL
ncbi:hypothetical protein AMTR_s00133p00066320 [Amborella trichopoda]|uniref:Retrovirus-related Pol polyprotein from transposon TNT 1-94-like beta-barrel domain-containing protein n=1 Tax=Amborella trichopoda TaxID=13333 RepID=W1P9R0_AMBTC|nr:hypothetical protein AMTR_s00133p00066320 [Amborella trichopoda]